MKKNRVFRWLLLFAGLGFILFIGSHLFMHFGGWGQRTMAAWPNGGSKMQVIHRGMFHNGFRQGQMGMMGGGMGMGGMKHVVRARGIFGLGFIIAALIIAAIGWFLRKNAKGSMVKKWGGWLLIAMAALMILRRALPLLLIIIIGIVIWKLLAKNKKENKVETYTAAPSFEPITTVSSKTGTMLDEWERKISKEEK